MRFVLVINLLVFVVVTRLLRPLVKQIVAKHRNNNSANLVFFEEFVNYFHGSYSFAGACCHCQYAMFLFHEARYSLILMSPFVVWLFGKMIRPICCAQLENLQLDSFRRGIYFQVAILTIPQAVESFCIRFNVFLCASPSFKHLYAFIILKAVNAIIYRTRKRKGFTVPVKDSKFIMKISISKFLTRDCEFHFNDAIIKHPRECIKDIRFHFSFQIINISRKRFFKFRIYTGIVFVG